MFGLRIANQSVCHSHFFAVLLGPPPFIDDQLRTLREYAKATSAIIVLISQVDRAFELTGKPMPDLSDIRRPNPLDLSPFDKACFLHNG